MRIGRLRPHHESMTASHQHMTNVFVGSSSPRATNLPPYNKFPSILTTLSSSLFVSFLFGPRLLIDSFVDERRIIESGGTAITPRVESSHFFRSSRTSTNHTLQSCAHTHSLGDVFETWRGDSVMSQPPEQRASAARAAPSQTITTTEPSTGTEGVDAPPIQPARILRLRGARAPADRSVQWAEDVVDNEGLGRKSSKGKDLMTSEAAACKLTRNSLLHISQTQGGRRVERRRFLLLGLGRILGRRRRCRQERQGSRVRAQP